MEKRNPRRIQAGLSTPSAASTHIAHMTVDEEAESQPTGITPTTSQDGAPAPITDSALLAAHSTIFNNCEINSPAWLLSYE